MPRAIAIITRKNFRFQEKYRKDTSEASGKIGSFHYLASKVGYFMTKSDYISTIRKSYAVIT